MNELKGIFEEYGAVVFFDTETTGLDADTCQIIELAAIRIERNEDGTLRIAGSMDDFIKLPEGEKLPEKIVNLTGITDEQLEAEGVHEAKAAATFGDMIRNNKGPVLIVAYNAQFDLQFIKAMLQRDPFGIGDIFLAIADFLDGMTVYKDRRAYPHKLANAIKAYNLADRVHNSHRAIDDVEALFDVCRAMSKERDDLLDYVNVFGYNPKYGAAGPHIQGVTYWPQHSNDCMQAPDSTLPARCKKKQTPKEEQQNA